MTLAREGNHLRTDMFDRSGCPYQRRAYCIYLELGRQHNEPNTKILIEYNVLKPGIRHC